MQAIQPPSFNLSDIQFDFERTKWFRQEPPISSIPLNPYDSSWGPYFHEQKETSMEKERKAVSFCCLCIHNARVLLFVAFTYTFQESYFLCEHANAKHISLNLNDPKH